MAAGLLVAHNFRLGAPCSGKYMTGTQLRITRNYVQQDQRLFGRETYKKSIVSLSADFAVGNG